MKYRVDVDGMEYALDLRKHEGQLGYELVGVSSSANGWASVVPAGQGTYSILLGERSLTVKLIRTGERIDAQVDGRAYRINITDARDRATKSDHSAAGPLEVASHMPGKVVKLLVKEGEQVESGQGLVVVEAMKMQNEIKSPKAGVVQKIVAAEGATVVGGQALLVVE